MDGYEQIIYSVTDQIATITLNRPEQRNAYTLRMADELADAFDRADNDGTVRVVVFTGSGDHFCVGADLSTLELDLPEGDQSGVGWQEPASRCSMRIFGMNKPVIAAIRGAAVGAGATIVLPADYRLVTPDTRFGYVFSRRGIFPEGASTWFLPRLVGLGRALDWMISGRVVYAAEAHAAGLVHSVHEPGELLPKAYQLAQTIISKTAPVSVAVIRQALYRMSALDSPEPVQALDSRLIAACLSSPDAVEGFTSFLERRDPRFTGRVAEDMPGFLPWLDQ